MNEHVKVEIVSRTVDADPETVEKRLSIAERLLELGHLDSGGDGDINRTATMWFARFGDVEVPLDAFEVQPPESGGKAMVSLLIAADSVQVGGTPVGAAPSRLSPAVPESKPAVSTWGVGKADPRASIPGWKPEHDHTHTKWTCGCDPVLAGIQEAAAKTGNIDLRVVGNTVGRLV